MRYSRLASSTVREPPRGAQTPGHALLLRAGFIRPLSQGLYSFLPLGVRVLERLRRLIRSELDALGGQEILLPLVNPLDLWARSGRSALAAGDLIEFTDRANRRMVLAPTHEEAVVELAKSAVTSCHQFPVFLYQFQTRYRNEARPRGGLLRTREFVMNDGYSFHRSFAGLNNFFPRVHQAYSRIFAACNVPVVVAEAAVGIMLGERSFEFLMPCAAGDDFVIRCSSCGYTANQDVANGLLEQPGGDMEPARRVKTTTATTMASLRQELGLPLSRLGKTMVYTGGGDLVFAVVRGDQEVSPEKLRRVLGCGYLELADRESLAALGVETAYVSPLELPRDLLELDVSVKIVVDEVVARTHNLAMAVNAPGSHMVNVNHGRDFSGDAVADIARVLPGARCTHCGAELGRERVIELGHVFKLGDYYSRRLDFSLTDEAGRRVHPHIGAYGIGMGRLMAAVAEANHDRRGIAWPEVLAPFQYAVIGIGRSAKVASAVESLHDQLGEEALLDDRRISIGARFKDADLIGIPFRLVVSPSSLERGEVELLSRGTPASEALPIARFAEALAERMAGSRGPQKRSAKNPVPEGRP